MRPKSAEIGPAGRPRAPHALRRRLRRRHRTHTTFLRLRRRPVGADRRPAARAPAVSPFAHGFPDAAGNLAQRIPRETACRRGEFSPPGALSCRLTPSRALWCHLLSSAVICCHVTAAREYEYSCSALTRARVLLLPRMPQGRAEGVAGLDLGLQVPLRSAASTANIAECRRGSCGCSLGRSRFFQNLLTAWPGFVSSSPQRTARVTGAR